MKKLSYYLFTALLILRVSLLSAQDSVAIYVGPDMGCAPLFVSASNMSGFTDYQGPVEYEWYVNGWSVSNNPATFDTTFTESGGYQIALEAYDTSGFQLGRDERHVSVGGLSSINFHPGSEVCPGEPVDVDFYSSGETTMVEWDFGNGDIRQGHHHTIVFDSVGVYPIQLTVDDNCGYNSITQELIVSDSVIPHIEIYTPGHSFCPGDPIEFETPYKDQPIDWDMGDGTMLYGSQVVHHYNQLGMYGVTATITNACGLTASMTDTIHIESSLEAWADFHYNYENGENCPGSPVRFESHSSGYHEWKFGDGITSNEPNPIHYYSTPGLYNVRLIVTNSCGSSDTAWQEVMIEYRDWEYLGFDPYFRFEQDNSGYYSDTLYLCPGESFRAYLDGGYGSGSDVEFTWHLGNGTQLGGDEIVYAYSEPGLYELSISATDPCHRYSYGNMRWIMVDPGIQPNVMLNYTPRELCPGEEVYFWDESWWEDESSNVYDIDFGDGSVQNNITDISDHQLRVLAYHSYQNIGSYQFTFSATNSCGNTVSLVDSIMVSNDASKKPFYYVSNSTSDEESGSGGPGELEIWDTPIPGLTHRFAIPVMWTEWSAAQNDTFFVYAWYGGFYPEGETGDPAGMIQVTSSMINVGDTFVIHVPAYPEAPSEIGFAVGWFCDPYKLDGEPTSWGTLMDQGVTVNSVPLFADSVTNVADFTSGAPVMLSPWDGTCGGTMNNVQGDWRGYVMDKVVFLNMYEDMGMFSYNLDIADDEQWTNSEYISGGQYDQYSESMLALFANAGYCSDTAEYFVQFIDDAMLLTLSYDPCSQQSMYLDSVWFYRNNSGTGGDGNAQPACPGDPVRFEIAGGSSYVWHFGDGTSSTQQFPMHSYDTAGMYEAYVIATNNCGRTDTIYTHVRVEEGILPMAYFYAENWDIKAGDTVVFMPDAMRNEVAEYYSYFWEFGDGATSTEMLGMHVYSMPGEYEVRLRVENGCGFSEESMHFYVQPTFDNCEVEARFDFEVWGDTLMLHNFSWGDSLEVHWDFGDGQSSNLWEPLHVYTEAGIYPICLSVFDPIEGCADQLCFEVMIGQLDCFAEFNTLIDDYTNTVRFVDQSSNANSWFWNFGDGTQGFKANPVHVYPEPGWYLVSLSIEDTLSGCFNYREREIWVGEIDTIGSCILTWEYFIDSTTVNFNPSVTGNITDGYWDFGDGNFGYEEYTSHTYDEPGIYTVCAFVFDSISGCQAEKCKELVVGEFNCHAAFVYRIDSLGYGVEFIDQSDGVFTEVYVDYGDGDYGTSVDTMHQYPGPGQYEVCIAFHNPATDCYREICKMITIPGTEQEPVCEASFTAIPVEGTLRIRFTENSLSDFDNWHWNFDDGGYDTLPNPSHTFPRAGVYRVCMTAYNQSTQCFDEVCKNISVAGTELSAPLSAAFSSIVNPETGNVRFVNSSQGAYTSAYWILGDGTTQQAPDTLRHMYQPGLYQVCLIVTNAINGSTDEFCKTITVGERPCRVTADFASFVNATSREVRLTDHSQGSPNTWFWTFGDGTTSTKRSPIKRYSEAGYYLISLAARDTLTGCADYTSELIQVGSAECFANFSYSVDPDTREVSFMNISSGDPSYFYWLFGDGRTSEAENPVHTFTNAGIYHVGMAITGSGGLCNSFAGKNVQVGSVDCNADFQVYVDSATNRAYFDAEIIGQASNLVWTFGDGGIANGRSVQHRYTAPGFYTVGLNTYNNANGCMDYTDKTILIGQSGVDVEPDFFYRVNETTLTVDFADNSMGEVANYAWNFGDGTTASDSDPSHTYPASGYYNVCLSVETAGGIANTRCKRIRVSNTGAECLSQFIYNVDSAALEASLTDLSLGEPDSWNWMFNDGQSFTTQNPIVTFDTAGLYRVELEVSNSSTGCSSTSFGVINVAKGSTGLIAAFIYDVDTSAFKASRYPVDLVAYPGVSAANYEWDLDDGSTYSGATEFTHDYSEPGVYNVCFTISDPVTGESATDCQIVSAETTVSDTSSTDGLMDTKGLINSITAYPNPFSVYTKIEFTLLEGNHIELDVYDETGRHVSNIIRTYREAGTHYLYWDAEQIDAGVYIVQLKGKNGSLYKHTCVVKQ